MVLVIQSYLGGKLGLKGSRVGGGGGGKRQGRVGSDLTE